MLYTTIPPTFIIDRTIMRICMRRSLRSDRTGLWKSHRLWISLNMHEVAVR